MKLFEHMDYLGDACLRILAKEYQPENPDDWNQKFGRNQFLAELYISVLGENLPKDAPNFKSKIGQGITHYRASHVEAWLGTAFEKGGMNEVKLYWDRLIKMWAVWRKKVVSEHLSSIDATVLEAGIVE